MIRRETSHVCFGFRQRVHRATGAKTVSINAIAARIHAIIELARACVQLAEQVFDANKVFVRSRI